MTDPDHLPPAPSRMSEVGDPKPLPPHDDGQPHTGDDTSAHPERATRAPRRTAQVTVNRAMLLNLRTDSGWSQAETARRAEVSQGHLSEIERGLTAPRPGTLAKLARAFGVTVADLVLGRLAGTLATTTDQLAQIEHPHRLDHADRDAITHLQKQVTKLTDQLNQPRPARPQDR